MHEVAASRRRVWFALLLAATFVVALSVGLTATPSSHPLRVEAAGAATVSRPHAHRASSTSSSSSSPSVTRPVRSSHRTASSPSTTAAPATTAAPTELARSSEHAAETAVAPTTTVRRVVAPTTTAAPVTTVPASAAAFLACIRMRESHDDYRAVSANGLYRGAYQFTQSSWDMAAAHAGRHDLVGVHPDQASPASQDAVALALYEWMGSAPWGGACG